MLRRIGQYRRAEDGESREFGTVGNFCGCHHHLGRTGGEKQSVTIDEFINDGRSCCRVILVIPPDYIYRYSGNTSKFLVDVFEAIKFTVSHWTAFLGSGSGEADAVTDRYRCLFFRVLVTAAAC